MICLALFGDQPRNAKVTEKLGISTNLRKTEISSEKIATAIREVLENDRYRYLLDISRYCSPTCSDLQCKAKRKTLRMEPSNVFRYRATARRLARMVRKKPVSPKDLLIKWTEFLAEFKTLENLVPAGNKLNWIQYHSVDVVLFLATIMFSVILIFYIVAKLVLALLCRRFKQNDEKKIL
ncbi:hypothetical protein RB195_002846 [Necator americanus]|uniref:glucuronosyltransferase n=1 Tax=Necator americanus TaxID=51031 RepID=A0ABR1DKX7_NECAM